MRSFFLIVDISTHSQVWKIGEADLDGYHKIKSVPSANELEPSTEKWLTAVSADKVTIEGL